MLYLCKNYKPGRTLNISKDSVLSKHNHFHLRVNALCTHEYQIDFSLNICNFKDVLNFLDFIYNHQGNTHYIKGINKQKIMNLMTYVKLLDKKAFEI